jgi:hypothetical protein
MKHKTRGYNLFLPCTVFVSRRRSWKYRDPNRYKRQAFHVDPNLTHWDGPILSEYQPQILRHKKVVWMRGSSQFPIEGIRPKWQADYWLHLSPKLSFVSREGGRTPSHNIFISFYCLLHFSAFRKAVITQLKYTSRKTISISWFRLLEKPSSGK